MGEARPEDGEAAQGWLEEHGVSYGRIAHDDWDSFVSAFAGVATSCGKRYTQGIEGNICGIITQIAGARARQTPPIPYVIRN